MSVSRIELGCAGHFICAKDCRFRRHTQVGASYRVSTVGDLYYGSDPERKTLGAGAYSFFETYVFRTNGIPESSNEGCGCVQVSDWCEIDSMRYATAGEAQRGHESFVEKYAAIAALEAA